MDREYVSRRAVPRVPTPSADDLRRKAGALRLQGIHERESGRFARAAKSFGDALDLASDAQDTLLAAEVLRERGDLRLRDGDPDGARSDWTEALGVLEDAGASADAARLRDRLATLNRWTAA